MKNKQLSLITETQRLEPDCFLSGTPAYPDYDVGFDHWQYYNQLDRVAAKLAEVIPFPALRLCEPPEEGWEVSNVVVLHPHRENISA